MSINVTRSSMPSYEEYCEEIRELWDSRWLTNMGTKHTQFEEALVKYLNTSNIVLFANGHSALATILAAFDFPKGGEVITTPFTFVSTTHAIVQNGLVPVFCDINPDDFTMDSSGLERLITEKTCAILPVHVYGNLCDVDGIQKIADRYGLKVIYDAAHAFGVSCAGTGCADYGDASMFSLHATKVFHSVEGGVVAFRDESLRTKLEALKNFGMTGQEDIPFVGGNAKMSEFHAAMGLCNLRHIDEEILKRKAVVARYRHHLQGVPGLKCTTVQADVQSNYAYFPVVISPEVFGIDRDAVCEALARENIFARKYFYPLTNCIACYAYMSEASVKTPTALRISKQVLTLPLYAELTMDDVDQICKIIKDCYKA